MITYRLNINCQEPKSMISDMEFVAGDVGAYRLEVTFRDNGALLTLSDKLFTLKAKRADGKVLTDCGTVEGNTAIITLKNGIYAVPGELILEIALTDRAENHVTAKIITATVLESVGEAQGNAEENISVSVSLLSRMKGYLDDAMTQASAAKQSAEEAKETSESFVKQAESFKAEVLQETGARHANALKGYARGETVVISDISPVAHDLDIKVSSKNVIPYPYTNTTLTHNGITFIDNGDGSLTVNGTATEAATFRVLYDIVNKPQPLKGGVTYYNNIPHSYISYNNEEGVLKYETRKTFTWDDRYVFGSITIRIDAGVTIENETWYPQIEAGTSPTSYTPHVDVSTVTLSTPTADYPVSPDGTVEGVKSIYPNTTLTTDTQGVLIECEYNKDINKGFAELVQAIISLGGNV